MNWGGCRRWNAGFEAFSAQLGWMRFFGVLRSHKKCRILKRGGREAEVRRIGREKAEFLTNMHPQCLQHHARYFPLFYVLYSNEGDERCGEGFLATYLLCALSCCLMIRERSAGPRMISRLGHMTLVACVREFALVLCAKPAICMDLQRRYMHLKICIYVSAMWIMVMSSIRAKQCFIHICRLISHPHWLPHASHDLFCMVPVLHLHAFELFYACTCTH